MAIEIKELVIRAFVADQSNKVTPEKPIIKEQNKAQDAISMVANMLKQEKER